LSQQLTFCYHLLTIVSIQTCMTHVEHKRRRLAECPSCSFSYDENECRLRLKGTLYILQYYCLECTDTIGWELNWVGWWHHCFIAELNSLYNLWTLHGYWARMNWFHLNSSYCYCLFRSLFALLNLYFPVYQRKAAVKQSVLYKALYK